LANPSTFQVYNASAGSGKTFTLVKEYLKIILKSPDQRLYQHILAITFTNKAATEMKDRILENLLRFSIMDKEDEQNDMLLVLMAETGLDRLGLKLRSKERLQDILKNYASFHIKTIDSFTNKLIKSFAFDLGLTSDFEVELDTDAILKEAVDEVLSRIGVDMELTKLLVSFSKEKTLEDKSWDVSRDLFEVSKLILNENHAHELNKLAENELSSFSRLSIKLRKEQKVYIKSLQELALQALDLIGDKGIDHTDFLRSQFPKFFLKMMQQPESLDFNKESSLSRNIEQRNFYAKSKPLTISSAIDSMADELIELYISASEIFEKFKLNELILKNLVPLAVINSIHQALEEIKTNNNIRLNAEFNQMISEHLINEPAAFIYEKLGERFKYFFIDEMQDTSVLQWQNLIPLIDNALSSEGAGLMLVGDAKQAIYRWRGGRAEQFINLSSDLNDYHTNPFQTLKLTKNLDTNYRSYSEIIGFNNRFFTHISQHFGNDDYRDLYSLGNAQKENAKKGGYVNLQFIESVRNAQVRDEIYPQLVHETIVELLEQFNPNEICILVRKKKEGVAIARYLTDQGMDIVSSETLLVKNNVKINFIIGLLQMLADDTNDDAKFTVLNFLYDHLGISSERHDFLTNLVQKSSDEIFKELERYQLFYNALKFNEYSIFEGVEDIIRSFRLTTGSDAFIQFFMDFVFDYTQRKSQKSISFLAYWEEKKEKLNIVSSDDLQAVRIMTIHKSKGLEFPVVIFPYNLDLYYEREPKAWYTDLQEEKFNDFDSILIDSSSGIKKTGASGINIFEEQRKEKELDSFNLLYVCLTRAVEQLYIISELKKSNDSIGTSAQLFVDFLSQERRWEENLSRYEFGNKKRNATKKDSSETAEIQKEFISSSWSDHQIHIVANSELLWDTERAEAIGYGNLIHEMMARIEQENDVEPVLEQFVNRGFLRKEEMNNMRGLVLSIVQHPLLRSYFQPGQIIINEREILTESGQVIIPDRLVIDQQNVTVIDYKTGKPNENHRLQIDNYALVLQKLNYKVLDKILVYIDENISVMKS
jgi:ATP-dependent exoDNAse (exonuclease V) beta subunit